MGESECSEASVVVSEDKPSLPTVQEDKLELQKSCTYVDKLNEIENLMLKISEECELGLHIVGVSSETERNAGILAMATNEQCYIFDLLALGDVISCEGLRKVLESESIVKVTHNCRTVSHYFSKYYDIKLKNVFDIEVAYVLKCALNNLDDAQEQQTPTLCEIFENILEKCIPVPDTCADAEEDIWRHRPLNVGCQTVIQEFLKSLLSLKERLSECVDYKMVISCVDFYLNNSTESVHQAVRIYKEKMSNSSESKALEIKKAIPHEMNTTGSNSSLSSFSDTSEDEDSPPEKNIHESLNDSISSYSKAFSPKIYHRIIGIVKRIIKDSVYIDNMDKAKNVMKNIADKPLIALEMLGANDGFLNNVGLFSVATESQVYVFDLKLLGESLFDVGLRETLESEEIVKVVHNCRVMSNILYHEYRVKLCNVFDTEVAYILKTAGEHRTVIHVAPALRRIFNSISPIPVSQSYGPKAHPMGLTWVNRPLSRDLQRFAARNVVHLIYLRKKMMSSINDELMKRCCDYYLSAIRDLDRAEVGRGMGKICTVPKELYDIVKEFMPDVTSGGWEIRSGGKREHSPSTETEPPLKKRRITECLVS
ncbi:uncharacterized protein [Anabrus simplex]|uniref:uncharacterized protein n=1 Tax=Anabrus simplex TaxID=316456 RepID=UPI0035A34D9E